MISRDELYDLVISGLPVALFVVDGDFAIIEFNVAAEKLTGWKREEVLGRPCFEILGSSLCRSSCPLRESEKTGKPCLGREAVLHTRNGKRMPIFFSSSAMLDDQGRMKAGIEVFRDATEIKKLEAQKKNLISLFTHDLKAPVAIVGGFVDRLLQEKAGPLTDKQGEYLRAIRKEISRLENYIHSFLDISRIEAGQVELQLEEQPIGPLLTEIVQGFRVPAADKKIHISLDIQDNLPPVKVDSLQFTRVISNLLDNAIKYSAPDKEVRVSAREEGEDLVIEIQDQGPGIAPDQQEHIFDAFYRIPGTRKKAGGSGLGLAAVRVIMEAHGGRAWVESKEGEGSRFKVAVPKQAPPCAQSSR